jgi:hypothetical protein
VIITHDNRVSELADIVYQISNEQIYLVKGKINQESKNQELSCQRNSPKKFYHYVKKKTLSRTKKKVFLQQFRLFLLLQHLF